MIILRAAFVLGKAPLEYIGAFSLEEQFYLVASASLLLGYRTLFFTFLVLASAWNMTSAWVTPWSFGWVLRPYGLSVGSGLAFIFWKWPGFSTKKIANQDRLVLAMILVCSIMFLAVFYNPLTTLLACVLCGVLVWLATMDGCFSRTFVGRWVEYLGERSYSFYLCHVVVIIVARDIVIWFTDAKDVESLPQSWFLCVALFGAALMVSNLSYRHIEDRFRLRRNTYAFS